MVDAPTPGHSVGPTGPTGGSGASGAQGPIAPTGAGGPSGAPGSPGHPLPPKTAKPTRAANLSETQEGAQLIHSYDLLQNTFRTTLPDLIAQLSGLAHRPIGG